MVDAQPGICPGEWDTQTTLGFWDTNASPNHSEMTRRYDNQQQQKKKKKKKKEKEKGKREFVDCKLCCLG